MNRHEQIQSEVKAGMTTSRPKRIVWISEGLARDPSLVGSKASVLAALAQAGIVCPTGFCVTTRAWAEFQSGLLQLHDTRTQTLSQELDVKPQNLRDHVLATPLSRELRSELEDHWSRLCQKARKRPLLVAVRSSSVFEDLPSASFAGQYSTILAVATIEDVERAIKSCWASSMSDRVLFYRNKQGITGSDLSIAVLVQELVRADAAGTAFAANPVSGSTKELVVEATLGLGEPLVSGRIKPDRFIFNTSQENLILKEIAIGTKRIAVYGQETGGLTQTPVAAQGNTAIAPEAAMRVGRLVQAVSEMLGKPQDIEWAFEGDELFLLQSRPITTLHSRPTTNWVFIVKKRLSWFVEMLQLMGTSRAVFEDSLGISFEFRNARMVRFHEFLDQDELEEFDLRLWKMFAEDRNVFRRIADRCYQRCEEIEVFCRAIRKKSWEGQPSKELLGCYDEFFSHMIRMIPVVYTEPDFEGRIKSSLKHLFPEAPEAALNERFLILTSTSKEVTIVKEQRAVLRMGGLIQKSADLSGRFAEEDIEELITNLPPHLVSQIDAHISEYGWINTDDLYGTPWTRKDILQRLRYLVSSQDCEERLQKAHARSRAAEREYQELRASMKVDNELLELIDVARINSHLRTHRTEVFVKCMYQARGLLSEVASRIGLDDYGYEYLAPWELRAFLEGGFKADRAEVKARTVGMAYEMKERTIVATFGADVDELLEEEKCEEKSDARAMEKLIQGTTANLGVVRGTARVVSDLSELDKVLPGDILVASMTIPEFVPAMERAAAFVTDEGGITCHAAIVSRELGVPCVIGTEVATKLLRDGDEIEVDGFKGAVRIIKRTGTED